VSLHDETEATERDGPVILQIDTYGRSTRQVQGKQSQTIQINREGVQVLYGILKHEFHFWLTKGSGYWVGEDSSKGSRIPDLLNAIQLV
jgi:hypothetical protein